MAPTLVCRQHSTAQDKNVIKRFIVRNTVDASVVRDV